MPVIASITGAANYGGVLGDYGNFNPPRTWGLELSAKIGAPRKLDQLTRILIVTSVIFVVFFTWQVRWYGWGG